MAEPHRRATEHTARSAGQHDSNAGYANDVLLIADQATGHRNNGGSAGESEEPLDMESVVRKLIALLSEQQTGS